MATKWKKFTRNTWTKIGAFLLAVLLSGCVVWSVGSAALYMSENELEPLSLIERDSWIDSIMDMEENQAFSLYHLLYDKTDEESIRSGEFLTEQEIVDQMYSDYTETNIYVNEDPEDDAYLSDKKIAKLENLIARTVVENTGYMMTYSEYTALRSQDKKYAEEGISTAYSNWESDEYDQIRSEIAVFTAWIQNNRGAYEAAKQELIETALQDLYHLQNVLDEKEGYLYYGKSKQSGMTYRSESGLTVQKLLDRCPLVYQFDPKTGTYSFLCSGGMSEITQRYTVSENEKGEFSQVITPWNIDHEYTYEDRDKWDADDVLLVGATQDLINGRRSSIDSLIQKLWAYLICGVVCAVLLLTCCIILCCGAGRRSQDAPAELLPFDKIWSEVQIGWVGGIVFFGIYAAMKALWGVWGTVLKGQSSLALLLPALIPCAVAALCLPCLQSQVRRIKTRTWLDGFILWRVLKWTVSKCKVLFQKVRTQYQKGSLHARVIVLAVILPLISAIPPLSLIVMVFCLVFGLRAADRTKAVLEGAQRIRAGETDTQITVQGGKEMKQLADDLNSISEGLGNAVKDAVKSERLKSELISNVSHDLKTPLTGIITYVDLMKQLSPDDPKMKEYLQTVDQKTQRLSVLINDLLEASKASSGAMKTERTKVNFAALFEQACGEIQQKLDAAGLQIRTTTVGRTDIAADGRLLWRVLDNLLTNCARYAAPNSRVYVDIAEQEQSCMLTMKNISAQELNISADELMERFTRGDRSRHTEGSGLGLSIANSLTTLMGGWFHITIDGDLFKAEVSMPLWTEQPQGQAQKTEEEQPAAVVRPKEEPELRTQPLDVDYDPERTQKIP